MQFYIAAEWTWLQLADVWIQKGNMKTIGIGIVGTGREPGDRRIRHPDSIRSGDRLDLPHRPRLALARERPAGKTGVIKKRLLARIFHVFQVKYPRLKVFDTSAVAARTSRRQLSGFVYFRLGINQLPK